MVLGLRGRKEGEKAKQKEEETGWLRMSCFPCLSCPLSSSLFGLGIKLTEVSKCLWGEGWCVKKCTLEA